MCSLTLSAIIGNGKKCGWEVKLRPASPPTFSHMQDTLIPDMPSVKDHSDYRRFLLAYYEAKRKACPFFSYRFMAKRLGVDHAYVLRILNRKAHLADRHISRFTVVCHLDRVEADYFRTLVRFNKTKDLEEAAALKDKLGLSDPDWTATDPGSVREREPAGGREPVDARGLSAMKFAIRAADMGKLRERISAFRRDVMSLADSAADPDAVFGMEMSLLPLE